MARISQEVLIAQGARLIRQTRGRWVDGNTIGNARFVDKLVVWVDEIQLGRSGDKGFHGADAIRAWATSAGLNQAQLHFDRTAGNAYVVVPRKHWSTFLAILEAL